MATKPKSWQPQVNVNTKRMKSLMDNIRSDVVRRTRNCDDLDKWMTELSEYTTANCFTTGIHAAEATEIANQIANVVNQTSLPSGSNAELVKGTMAEACYTMVSRVGDDLKNEMRRIAVESYNNRNTPAQTAKLLGERIDSLSRSRCQAIARTETCRAANLANYLNAKEMGAKSYRVLCNDGCCEYCQEEYGTDESGGTGETLYDIEDTDSLPPLHPNCRCTPVWSMEEPEGSNDNSEDEATGTEEINEILGNVLNEYGISELTPTGNSSRISELEKEIADQKQMADKWESRGNSELAKTFNDTAKRLQNELNEIKSQDTPKPIKENTKKEIPNKKEIDDVLNQVLTDVGLKEETSKTTSETPIEKNIKTTHESNLWENLADIYEMELTEASNSFVKFYDKQFDTSIEFNIGSNKEWIDYTNSNKKVRNMEEFLKSYKEAPSNLKKSSPPIKIVGSERYDGVCELSGDIFHIKIGRSGYQELELQKGSGNLQQTLFHEMSHAHDMRLAPDRTFARMGEGWWASSQKGGDYKKATTKDRRNRKETGAKQFVSEYAKTGSSGGRLHEDYAELSSIVMYRDIADKSSAYLLEYNSKGELVKVGYEELKTRYPNKWKVIEDYVFGDYQCRW